MNRYGPLSHPAAQAGTVHEPMPVESAAPKGIVATFTRAAGGVYRVVRDAVAHQGVGLYRVLAGERYIGSQVSRPGAEDCARLEREARAPAAAPETRPVTYGYYGRRPAPARSHAIQTVAGEKVKRCSGCREARPLSAFSRGSGPGGYQRHCKQCMAEWSRSKRASA